MIFAHEDNLPHTVSEVICVKCGKRWLALRPSVTRLKELECPECNQQGFVIETGQPLDDLKQCDDCKLFVNGKCKVNLSDSDEYGCEYKIKNE